MNLHLTHDQLCDLILADASLRPNDESDVVEQHLQACLICSAELKSLRDSISHFRDASSAFARHEFAQSYAQRSSIVPPHSYLSQPLYWAAAAVIFVAALFPITLHHYAASSAVKATAVSPQTESDDALLADIDQKVSADVPSPMEPLADPTDGTTSTTSTSDQRTN
jgi:hypothetical protein